MQAILLDIGGTNTRVGVSRGSKPIAAVTIRTPRRFENAIDAIAAQIRTLTGGSRVNAAAVGIAGVLNGSKTALLTAPNLPGWTGKPLARRLQKIIGAQVVVENDSALVGLGEATRGAGKGYRIVAYLGIGTGVGGAKIVAGRIDENAFGFEPGHQIVDPHGPLCYSCRRRGHLEAFIAGGALKRRLGRSPKTIFDRRLWQNVSRTLAIGVANLIVLWSPDIVVLGGAMMTRPGIILPTVRKTVRDLIRIFPKIPPIVRADLGDGSGLYGGLTLLRQRRLISAR